MKRAIVTGAAGFAGWNLVQILIQAGYFVYAVVRPYSAHNIRLCRNCYLTVIELDMRDLWQLSSFIDVDCDVFFHLAWQGERNDFAAQYQNVAFSLAALEAATQLHCLRFVCTGSQADPACRRQHGSGGATGGAGQRHRHCEPASGADCCPR